MKGKLWFVIGLPRSGKTTWCEEWSRTYREREGAEFRVLLHTDRKPKPNLVKLDSNPRVVVSGDCFRQALHGHAYIPEAEGTVFANIDIATRALLLNGHDVIIDETATTEATIHRYFKIDIEARPVWIDTPADVCIQRAIDTGKPFLVEPIKRMATQLEKLKAGFPANFLKIQEYCRVRQNQDIHV